MESFTFENFLQFFSVQFLLVYLNIFVSILENSRSYSSFPTSFFHQMQDFFSDILLNDFKRRSHSKYNIYLKTVAPKKCSDPYH